MFVALDALPNEGNFGSHVPANGSAKNINVFELCKVKASILKVTKMPK